MASPIENARRRPQMSPSFPPVSISAAIVREYRVITPWMVVTVVWKSATSCEIETFITDWSRTIRNWAAARTRRTERRDVVLSAWTSEGVGPLMAPLYLGPPPAPGASRQERSERPARMRGPVDERRRDDAE